MEPSVEQPDSTAEAPVVADRYSFVVGVDTHARHHVLAIVTSAGRLVETRQFATSPAGLDRAVAWIARRTETADTDADVDHVLVSMESVGCYGAILAGRLSGGWLSGH